MVLTIVTPVLNGEHFIRRNIESIMKMKTPHEHIVVDGSQIEIGGNDKYKPLCYKCYLKEIYRERGKISEII